MGAQKDYPNRQGAMEFQHIRRPAFVVRPMVLPPKVPRVIALAGFPDYSTHAIRNTEAGTEMTLTRWGISYQELEAEKAKVIAALESAKESDNFIALHPKIQLNQ